MDRSKVVALYVRVSTEKQAEGGYSLEAQENVLRDKVISQGKAVYKVYRDAGFSGAKADRPGLLELLSDAEKGLFGSLYVWSVDRVSRNLSHFLAIVEKLRKYEVQLQSINESFDISTPSGRFALGFLGSIAQSQRETIRANALMGSRKKAQSGKFSGGSMLGYKHVPDEDDPRGGTKLVVEESEAVIVRTIFNLYCSGYGLKATASRVNEQGMCGKRGSKFSVMTVKGILTNKAYIGMVKHGGEYYQGVHEPIIDMELWDKAQSILSSKQRSKKIIDYQYMLSGLVKCPICGCGMIASHVNRKNKDGSIRRSYYYVCGQYMNKGAGSCTGNAVRAKEADAAVMNFLIKHLCSENWKKIILSKIKRKFSVNSKVIADIKHLKASLDRLKNKQSCILLKYEEGALEKDCLLQELAKIKAEIKQAEAQLTLLDTRDSNLSYDEKAIMGALAKLPKLIERAPDKDRIKLLRGVIKSVYVDSDRVVSEIEVYVPELKLRGTQQTLTIKI